MKKAEHPAGFEFMTSRLQGMCSTTVPQSWLISTETWLKSTNIFFRPKQKTNRLHHQIILISLHQGQTKEILAFLNCHTLNAF